MLLSVGTIVGCLILPFLAGRFGRRGALAFYFALMFVVHLGRLRVRVLSRRERAAVVPRVPLLPRGRRGEFLGLHAMASRAVPHRVPRQRLRLRDLGRAFVAAGVTFLVGAGVARMQTIGTPVALTSIAFLIGLALLPLAHETRGKELPV